MILNAIVKIQKCSFLTVLLSVSRCFVLVMKFYVWKMGSDQEGRLRIATEFGKTASSNKQSNSSIVLSIANNTSREFIESSGLENIQTHGKGDENKPFTDMGGTTQKMHEKNDNQKTHTEIDRSGNSLKNRILLEIRKDITKQMTEHNLTSTLQRLVLSSWVQQSCQ